MTHISHSLQAAPKVGVYVITNREHAKFSDCKNAIKREMGNFPFFVIRDGKTRGEGRQICIDDARKRGFDWICFVDDDFVLNEGWWADVSRYIDDPKVGMIWGMNWDHDDTRKNWINYLHSVDVPIPSIRLLVKRKLDKEFDAWYKKTHPPRKASSLDYAAYLEHEFKQRGGTHDTLIRLDAIPEWIRIPNALHVYEDKFLKQIVEIAGYKCIATQTGGIHYNMVRWDGKSIVDQLDHDKMFYHEMVKPKARIFSMLYSPLPFYYRYKVTRSLKAAIRYWWYHFILYNLKCLLLPQIYNLDPEPINMMLLMFEGKTCYDIGANMGYTSLILSKNFENVFAFEPSLIYEKLKKNVSQNKKIHVFNIAIGDHDGKLTMEKREIPWKTGQLVADKGTIYDEWGKLIEKVTVDCKKIDSMDDIVKPDFMKIDVEGFELDVINGALETIQKYKPGIFIEIHSDTIGSEIKNLLSPLYQIYHVDHPYYKEDTQIKKEHYFLFCIPK